MSGERVDSAARARSGSVMPAAAYDPFIRGRFTVGVATFHALDSRRNRRFPCEIWYPAAESHRGQDLSPATQDLIDAPGTAARRQSAVRDAQRLPGLYPLILLSHSSGDGRRQSTFLCTHLASHGYLVAALDHSERVAPELARRDGETPEQRTARIEGWIANRVPDVRFLLDHLLEGETEPALDRDRIGIVGHSFGGWTALATPEVDDRIRAVVALAPAGSANPPPNIIPAKLTFQWRRDVPTLYLVAEDDTALPLAGMYELLERTRSPKRMVILRGADHGHFMDQFDPEMGACAPEEAHRFVRGLTLAHFDAALRESDEARRFWTGDVAGTLESRGVHAIVPERAG